MRGQNQAAPNVAPAGAGAVTKPDQELRPPKLNNDTTMGELRDWKEQFTSYYNSSNLRQMIYLQQQGLSLIHISGPRDLSTSRMPSSA